MTARASPVHLFTERIGRSPPIETGDQAKGRILEMSERDCGNRSKSNFRSPASRNRSSSLDW
jgi:hypothetical protein